MKLLVTGGDGFIGSNFILHTLTNFPKIEIINLDAGFYAITIISEDSAVRSSGTNGWIIGSEEDGIVLGVISKSGNESTVITSAPIPSNSSGVLTELTTSGTCTGLSTVIISDINGNEITYISYNYYSNIITDYNGNECSD